MARTFQVPEHKLQVICSKFDSLCRAAVLSGVEKPRFDVGEVAIKDGVRYFSCSSSDDINPFTLEFMEFLEKCTVDDGCAKSQKKWYKIEDVLTRVCIFIRKMGFNKISTYVNVKTSLGNSPSWIAECVGDKTDEDVNLVTTALIWVRSLSHDAIALQDLKLFCSRPVVSDDYNFSVVCSLIPTYMKIFKCGIKKVESNYIGKVGEECELPVRISNIFPVGKSVMYKMLANEKDEVVSFSQEQNQFMIGQRLILKCRVVKHQTYLKSCQTVVSDCQFQSLTGEAVS